MIDRDYKDSLRFILEQGVESSPRGMRTKEIISYTFKLYNSRNCIIANKKRNLNYAFMVAEWLWIMFGRNDVKFISTFNKKISAYSDDGKSFYGAYGPEFSGQLKYVYETLLNDPDSRQAVFTMWKKNPKKSKDIPCTISHQYLIRDGKLHIIASMRSNDAYLGMPYDTFNFCQIGNLIAGMLGVERGSYTLFAGSFHLYEEHFEKAEKVSEFIVGDYLETNDIGIKDYEDYIKTKNLFETFYNYIIKGTLNQERINRFPIGIREHINFLNEYKSRNHRKADFWKDVYEQN